ncbi:MAG: aminoacyl--tRNA ligase-related protein [Promethearchaeota archaeon]
MEYELFGKYILNKKIEDKDDNIKRLIKEVEDDIFKGIKNIEELNYKSEYDIKDGKIIDVKISTLKRAAHEFFYRIQKYLAPKIGKQYHVRVQENKIDKLKIIFDIEKLPKDNETIKIPFISELKYINGKACQITFDNINKDFIVRNYIERIIKLIKEKIDRTYYEGKAEYHNVIYESPKRDIKFDKDPTDEMVKKRWLTPGPTKGKWVYWPPATALFRTMEKIVVEELLKPLQFKELMGSNIIAGEDIWLKTGHLAGMPMELYYVAEPKTRNPEVWEDFIDLVKVTRKVPYDHLKELIQFKPLKGLTYAQCPMIYWSLKGRTIASDNFPIKVFDRTVNSFRYESGGRHGIERVDEFHRVEIVYIGTPEQLKDLAGKLLERYKYIFNEIMELEWRMAKVTPFYMQQAGDIFKNDLVDSLLGTIDFEIWLPYRGPRTESEWLEFQNLSVVGEKYVKAFNIKAQKNEQLWSGCTGVGLERWVAGFLAQKGFDVDNWPEKFKKYLVEIPEPFTIF